MASNPLPILGFIFFLIISLSTARNIPSDDDAKFVDDKKEPEFLGMGKFGGTAWVPGMGRFMIPKKGYHKNPFTYNPITGTNNGKGFSIPSLGGTPIGGGSYIPGGDDTLILNPGFEVPNPAFEGISTQSDP